MAWLPVSSVKRSLQLSHHPCHIPPLHLASTARLELLLPSTRRYNSRHMNITFKPTTIPKQTTLPQGLTGSEPSLLTTAPTTEQTIELPTNVLTEHAPPQGLSNPNWGIDTVGAEPPAHGPRGLTVFLGYPFPAFLSNLPRSDWSFPAHIHRGKKAILGWYASERFSSNVFYRHMPLPLNSSPHASSLHPPGLTPKLP